MSHLRKIRNTFQRGGKMLIFPIFTPFESVFSLLELTFSDIRSLYGSACSKFPGIFLE